MSDFLKFKLALSDNFTGDGSTKIFTFRNQVINVKSVTVNGIASEDYRYNVDNNNIEFINTAPVFEASIIVEYIGWFALPTIVGKEGKSAYISAREGGFTGTEAEFNVALAAVISKQGVINVNGILKGDGTGHITTAEAGKDYAVGNHNHDGVYAPNEHSHNYAAPNHTHDYAASNHNHDTAYAPASHTHAAYADKVHGHSASEITTAGSLGAKVTANASAVSNLGEKQVRNIYAGTTDMVAGSTPLTSGDIYIYYEA